MGQNKILVNELDVSKIDEDVVYRVYSEYIDSTIIGKGLKVFEDFAVLRHTYKTDIPDQDTKGERTVEYFNETSRICGIQLTDEIYEMTDDETAMFIAEII